MKILLVDDSKTMRNIQRKSLTALGEVEFAEAGDGVEALQVIGATIHALGLTKVQSKFDGSALSPFLIGASKALF